MRICHEDGRRFLSVLLLCGICGLSAGCLFTPRTPESPSSGDAIEYLPRNSPENIWANAEISLENADSFGWDEAISENFQYIPDSDASSQFPGVFDGWNKEREMAFINGFYDTEVSIEAQMRDDDFVIPDDSSGEVDWENVIYDIIVTSDAAGSVTRYRASAIITFKLEDNFWYIYRWEDLQGENNPDNPEELLSSMGVLRGTFGSN